MKVVVTPECRHPVDGHPGDYSEHGAPITGRAVIADGTHVIVNGRTVLVRDRRAKKNRTPGHPWVNPDTGQTWTGIRVEVTA